MKSIGCSFCGEKFSATEKCTGTQRIVLSGTYGNICDKCVALCANLIAEAKEAESVGTMIMKQETPAQ